MADEVKPPDYGPGRTPLLGFLYTSDSSMNANLDRLDAILGPLHLAANPPQPAPAPQPLKPAK
jgi:hypothetical protein